jgi:hypothetical protein
VTFCLFWFFVFWIRACSLFSLSLLSSLSHFIISPRSLAIFIPFIISPLIFIPFYYLSPFPPCSFRRPGKPLSPPRSVCGPIACSARSRRALSRCNARV